MMKRNVTEGTNIKVIDFITSAVDTVSLNKLRNIQYESINESTADADTEEFQFARQMAAPTADISDAVRSVSLVSSIATWIRSIPNTSSPDYRTQACISTFRVLPYNTSGLTLGDLSYHLVCKQKLRLTFKRYPVQFPDIPFISSSARFLAGGS
jgi:hypothetical protein